MTSMAQLATVLQRLLTTVADAAARETGFVQRVRQLTGALFVQTLVFGWLNQPQASYSALTAMGGTCGLTISSQGLAQRFTAAAAACLRTVLERAMQELVVSTLPVALPLLQRFNGVYLSDSTTITLPDSLAAVWAGCGGRVATNTQAGLKVQVRWEFTRGQLALLPLQPSRESDRAADAAAPPLPAGALRLVDLGYVGLAPLQQWVRQQVDVLCPLPLRPALFDATGQQRAGGALLLAQHADLVDLPVLLGAQERVPVRLLAQRVPPQLAERRRRQWRAEAKRNGRGISAARLALADWNVYITTVSAERLTAREGVTLARARWQIELLFKLWKQHGRVDEWRSANPWRILCEVYAKLLAVLIQHWCLLLQVWADPRRSLVKAAAAVRQHALSLAAARMDHARLDHALTILVAALTTAGRLNTSRQHRSTAHRLLDCSSPTALANRALLLLEAAQADALAA